MLILFIVPTHVGTFPSPAVAYIRTINVLAVNDMTSKDVYGVPAPLKLTLQSGVEAGGSACVYK
jgi:hypothetical protein